jgi:uncharacterized protein (DUF1800 family)
MFDPLMHVDGDKVVLGKTIKSGGVEEGEQLLRMLAHHESTARFISTKLARRFISDDPPAAVVTAASRTFMQTGGTFGKCSGRSSPRRNSVRRRFTAPDRSRSNNRERPGR